MPSYIQRVLNPDWYHGHKRQAPYFEGWYFKVISADEKHRFAFIPGIFKHHDPAESHAFIQVLDGMKGKMSYHRYPVESFRAVDGAFDVHVGESRFRRDCVQLHIDDEHGQIIGQLDLHDLTPWPITLWSPGIMGWFGWLPNMETNHGIVSLDHRITGAVRFDDTVIDFNEGRGYAEKDWGTNFPKGYIWHQTNHFDAPGTSLIGSIATVPQMGATFAGFIVGFWHQGKLYRFTTYNGSRVTRLRVDEDHVEWELENRQHYLRLVAERAPGTRLKSPEKHAMYERVEETMRACVHVTLSEKVGRQRYPIFAGKGRNLALEVVGDLGLLLTR